MNVILRAKSRQNCFLQSIKLENEEKIKLPTFSFDGWHSNEIKMSLYTLTEKNCPIVSKISEKILISATHLQDKSSGFNLTKFFASQKFENFLKSSVFVCLFVYDFEKFWRQTVTGAKMHLLHLKSCYVQLSIVTGQVIFLTLSWQKVLSIFKRQTFYVL